MRVKPPTSASLDPRRGSRRRRPHHLRHRAGVVRRKGSCACEQCARGAWLSSGDGAHAAATK
ncbi:hypothetical protein U9M48_009096 [Paspalum notatum var. saurae]|uniref:Uncharacterized protein n=1 Tax=Paspalum notatum var. saurae TaxID=547442 RepID=A0AAQ3WEG4_PASNO